jgi:hypothetical protein
LARGVLYPASVKRRAVAAECEEDDPRHAGQGATEIRVIPKHELKRMFDAADAFERMRAAYETLPYAQAPVVAEDDERPTMVLQHCELEEEAVTIKRAPAAARPRRLRRALAAALLAAVLLVALSVDRAIAGQVYRAARSHFASAR